MNKPLFFNCAIRLWQRFYYDCADTGCNLPRKKTQFQNYVLRRTRRRRRTTCYPVCGRLDYLCFWTFSMGDLDDSLPMTSPPGLLAALQRTPVSVTVIQPVVSRHSDWYVFKRVNCFYCSRVGGGCSFDCGVLLSRSVSTYSVPTCGSMFVL